MYMKLRLAFFSSLLKLSQGLSALTIKNSSIKATQNVFSDSKDKGQIF